MMPTLLNTNMAWAPHISTPGSSTTSAMLNELSLQLAASNPSRLSRRPSSSQRPVNAMRVTKPRSANNSPRAAISQSRRRTLIGENFQNHRSDHQQQVVDMTYLPTPASEIPSQQDYEAEKRSARPVSWHPSSYHVGQPAAYQQQSTMVYPYPAYSENDGFSSFHQYPPTPAVYSGYNTPSGFSPLSLPYSYIDSDQYFPPATQAFATQPAPLCLSTGHSPRFSPGPISQLPHQPFGGCSAPPTPEDINQCQQPQAKLATEELIPFEPLQDDEAEGEILYGMGLYDPPEKSCGNDFALDLRRSTIMSLLGGSAGDDYYPEPTGKGLKLEESWEPPASDDEEEEEESDQDAEGDD